MISIIIPTYNKVPRLRLTLAALRQIHAHELTELVIVDDGSTDETNLVIEEFRSKLPEGYFSNIQYIRTQNKGRASARNTGAQTATGKWLLFIDDDVLLDPHFILEHLLKQKQNGNCVSRGIIYSLPFMKFFHDPQTGELYNGGFAKGPLVTRQFITANCSEYEVIQYLKKNRRVNSFEKDISLLFHKTELSQSNVRWLGFVGANVCIPKDLFHEAGEFDIEFGLRWGCEDLELGYRLYQMGVRFVYVEAAVNYHMSHYRATADKEHRINMLYFYQKYGDPCLLDLKRYFEKEINIEEWMKAYE